MEGGEKEREKEREGGREGDRCRTNVEEVFLTQETLDAMSYWVGVRCPALGQASMAPRYQRARGRAGQAGEGKLPELRVLGKLPRVATGRKSFRSSRLRVANPPSPPTLAAG